MSIRIGICEDDPFTLSTLQASLINSNLEVIFAVRSAAEAAKCAQETSPAAVIIDLHLGNGPSGLDLARALRRQNLQVGLVFLTSFESPRLLLGKGSELPADSAYLVKRDVASIAQIVAAVNDSIERKPKSKTWRERTASLTDRQIEVLQLVAEGASNQEIAMQLGIEIKSVEGAIRRIARSMGIEANQTLNQRVHMARVYLKASGDLRA